MLETVKAYIPKPLLQAYHYVLVRLAAVWFGQPSNRLIVIGVTGTKGKTTTAYFIAKALEATGAKVGCTTTALFKVADREWINATKMTMRGRFALQRMLKEMVTAGCRYAVIETSSQGLDQYRHVGVNYDVAVLTNLTPEHIEAHGGFENYKAAKKKLFTHLARCPKKNFDGRPVDKTAILNADSQYAEEFAAASAGARVEWFGREQARGLFATDVARTDWGSRFHADGVDVELHLPGEQNIENALAALAVCQALNLSLPKAAAGLASIDKLPGRFERIDAGQPWIVIVDYAHEPESVSRLYQTVANIPHQRLIHVFGSSGGGRDVARRAVLGQIAGQHADIMIVTDEDPHDENPLAIMEAIARAARLEGKREGDTLFLIPDRQKAIEHAMRLARPGDLVMLTGKGSETSISAAHGKKIPWNEAQAATGAIKTIQSPKP